MPSWLSGWVVTQRKKKYVRVGDELNRSPLLNSRTVKPQQRFRNVYRNCSFEGNQSFPRLSRKVRPMMEMDTPTKVKHPSELVRG